MKFKIEHWQMVTAMLVVYDYLTVLLSYFLALWLRFDCSISAIDPIYLQLYFKTIFIYGLICIAIFWSLRLYKSIWRFASYSELIRTVFATGITFVISLVLTLLMSARMPISYYLIGIILQFIFTIGIRFSYRFILLIRSRNSEGGKKERVMIIGAGSAGQMILRDIKHTASTSQCTNGQVYCFIDDNPNKWGRYIDNIPVFGGRDRIIEAVDKFKIDKIYVAIPSSSPKDKRDILAICNETNCELLNLPGMYQLYTGQVTVSKMKPVQIEDLLGRDPISTDMSEVYEYITGKTVLVTGVGSIGSELARQIAKHNPKLLVLFDIYENNAYEIQLELIKKYPFLKLVTIIGSVRDSRKIFDVFEKYHPDIVYHAAAHKHVPLMEDSPCEAIKNNVLGTYKTAYAALAHGCKRFVLISTDKAVNPTNIMGASKRLCEMVIQAFDAKVKQGKATEIPQLFSHVKVQVKENSKLTLALTEAKTEFVAVRFGNVLGSNGSVVPLFKKQIEAGGPVTVTHPDIIRYFMTIPEAVSLVLLAGTYAKGGEIFVLDMGEPVKIETLARNLIRLSGYAPDTDIKIEFTGLRPGEKLYEEKLLAEEGLQKTKNKLIHIGCPVSFDIDRFFNQLDTLLDQAYRNKECIKETVESMVSTYHPDNVS